MLGPEVDSGFAGGKGVVVAGGVADDVVVVVADRLLGLVTGLLLLELLLPVLGMGMLAGGAINSISPYMDMAPKKKKKTLIFF